MKQSQDIDTWLLLAKEAIAASQTHVAPFLDDLETFLNSIKETGKLPDPHQSATDKFEKALSSDIIPYFAVRNPEKKLLLNKEMEFLFNLYDYCITQFSYENVTMQKIAFQLFLWFHL